MSDSAINSTDDLYPPVSIRPIRPEHYSVVAKLFQQCFDMASPPAEEYIGNLCHTDPEGCFLAWEGATPVGYGCVHSAGSVGFLGPAGVLKAHRGRGYGKALIEARVGYLAQRCAVIGLETWAARGDNIGRNYRLGFRETLPGRDMGRQAAPDKPSRPMPSSLRLGTEISPDRFEPITSAIRAWTEAIIPGLDFTKDLLLFLNRYPGRILFCFDGDRPCGFIAQHDYFRGETWFALEPSDRDEQVFETLVTGWEQVNWPNATGFHFHTHCVRLTDLLLARGYQVWNDTACMIHRSYAGPFTGTMTALFGRPWWS